MAKYRHTGTHPLVLDGGRDKDGFQIERHVALGDVFEADLSAEDEAVLLKSRAIVRVEAAPVAAPVAMPTDAGA